MGTRHLIAAQIDGAYKIAQYGQWDGYPSGQGVEVLAFLRSMERAPFLEKLRATSFYTEQELDALNEQFKREGINWQREYPWLSRDARSDILGYVANQPPGLKLRNRIEFAGDSLFCEWAYVIDFDAERLEVYKGFNKQTVPNDARFTTRASDAGDGYEPIVLVKTYSLAALPNDKQFLQDLNDADE